MVDRVGCDRADIIQRVLILARSDVMEFPFLLSAYLLVVAPFLAEAALFTLCLACVASGVLSTTVSTGLLGLLTIMFWLRL